MFRCYHSASLQVQIAALMAERDQLIAAEIKAKRCPFGKLKEGQDISMCPLGFPGCGCGDELMLNPFLQDALLEAIDATRKVEGKSVVVAPAEEKYLIVNIRDLTAGYNDGCILWFRPKSQGYTTLIEEAGRYTREEAVSMCVGGGGKPRDLKMVKESIVLAASRTGTYCWMRDLVPGRHLTKDDLAKLTELGA